jgi:hypothetical protein
MQCSDVNVLISNAVDGELSADEQVRLDAHLSDCAACREELESFRAMQGDLGLLDAPELPASIQQEIHRELAPNPHGFGRGAVAVAAALLIVVVAAIVMQPQDEPAGPSEDPVTAAVEPVEREQVFLAPNGDANAMHDAVELPGGDLLVGGNTMKEQKFGEVLRLLRVRPDGEVVWQKGYDGPVRETLRSLHATPDGGAIGVGQAGRFPGRDYDMLIVKFDAEGNIVWQKVLGGAFHDLSFDAAVAEDGGIVLTAISQVGTDTDMSLVTGPAKEQGHGAIWMIRMTADGEVLWHKMVDPSRSMDVLVRRNSVPQVELAPDGGGYISGASDRYSETGTDGWLIRFDAEGEIIWQRMYRSDKELQIMMLNLLDSGNLILSGTNGIFRGNVANSFAIAVDPDGEPLWAKEVVTPYLSGITRTAPKNGSSIRVGVRAHGVKTEYHPMLLGTFTETGEWTLDHLVEAAPGIRSVFHAGLLEHSSGAVVILGTLNLPDSEFDRGWLEFVRPSRENVTPVVSEGVQVKDMYYTSRYVSAPVLDVELIVSDPGLKQVESNLESRIRPLK